MQSLDVELQLRRYLELPVAERGPYGAAFVELAGRRLMDLRPRLVRNGERYMIGHGEDIASEVVLKAYEKLMRQFQGIEESWNLEDPMLKWMQRLLGRPFDRRNAGESTNYIRRERKQQPRSAIQVHDDGFSEADVSAIDGERFLLLLNEIEEQPQTTVVSAEFYSIDRRPRVEAALIEYPMKRDVFLFRVRTGIHPFEDLNPDTLSCLARDLKLSRATRQTIRRYAKMMNLNGRKSLDSKTSGALVSLSDRRVRQLVQQVAEWVRNSR